MRWQILIFLFLLGAIFGPIGDFFHLISGTDGYPAHSLIYPIPFLGVPAWVSLEFGLAVVLIGVSQLFFNKKLTTQIRRGAKNIGTVLTGLFLLLSLWAMSAFLPLKTGGGKDIALAMSALAIWFIFERTWQAVVLGFLTALVGTFVEMTLVHFDVFFYAPSVANFLGVPTWLPWLYFAASMVIGNLAKLLSLLTQ